MKTYQLFLHGKQGDDFADHLKATKSTEEALRSWAKSFKEAHDACLQLANAFQKKGIEAEADTHLIQFYAHDEEAKKVLEVMAKEKLLQIEEFDDEEEDASN